MEKSTLTEVLKLVISVVVCLLAGFIGFVFHDALNPDLVRNPEKAAFHPT